MGWGRKEKHILLNLSSLKLYVWKQNRYITTGIFGPDNLFMQKPRIQRAVAPICLISAAAEVKWSQASPCPTPELLGSLWEKHQSRTWFPTSRALPRPVASVGANSLLLDKQCPRESGPHWGVRSKGGPEVDGGVSRLWGWPPGKTSDCTRGRWKKGVGKTAEPSGGQRNRCRDPDFTRGPGWDVRWAGREQIWSSEPGLGHWWLNGAAQASVWVGGAWWRAGSGPAVVPPLGFMAAAQWFRIITGIARLSIAK